MKKKAIILIGILIVSSIFMISAGANYNKTISQNQCPGSNHPDYANDTFFVFTDVPIRPIGDGTLTVSVLGDYNSQSSEYIDIIVEGTTIARWVPGYQCPESHMTKTFTVTQSQLLKWTADGKIEVKLVQGPDVNCICDTNINIVTLEYRGVNNSLPMDWIIKKFGLGNKDKE